MVSTKLNDWMQLLGMLAIVASLLFVGLQIKQSQDIAIASQYQSRAESAMNYHLTGMEAGMSNAFFRTTPIEQMSPEQFNYGVSSNLWSWINLDNNYFQYQAGFMTDEAWIPYRQQIGVLYARCSNRWIYEVFRRSRARGSFSELLDSMNDPCTPEDKTPPWER
jgi:hypothetical protein